MEPAGEERGIEGRLNRIRKGKNTTLRREHVYTHVLPQPKLHLQARTGFEPAIFGLRDRRLTTWPPRLTAERALEALSGGEAAQARDGGWPRPQTRPLRGGAHGLEGGGALLPTCGRSALWEAGSRGVAGLWSKPACTACGSSRVSRESTSAETGGPRPGDRFGHPGGSWARRGSGAEHLHRGDEPGV